MAGPRASPDPGTPPRSSDDDRRRRRASDGGEEPPLASHLPEEETLPPWARFPRGGRESRGRAFDPDRPPTPEERWEETERVLKDLDGLREEVRRPGEPSESGQAPAEEVDGPEYAALEPELASRPAVPAVAPVSADVWAAPTSYLEERLRLARAAAEEVSRDALVLTDTWGRLRLSAAALAEEVRSAQEEMEFIRSAGQSAEPDPSTPPVPVPRTAPIPAPVPVARASARAVPGPLHPGPGHHVEVYSGFTAVRYDRTIAQLKARRRRLAGWTFLAAGIVSFVLILLTALAREPLPPIWLAALPAVWMIPVPFFILSFRGTQRVLRNNHLQIRGGTP